MQDSSSTKDFVNYSVPKYQLASIYKGLKRLSRHIHKLPFHMTQENKRNYGDRIVSRMLDCFDNYIIAFDFQDERPHYYMKLVGSIHVIMTLMDEIVDEHILIPQKHVTDKDGKQIPNKQDKLVIQIYEEIGKIDTDISKWRTSAISSKSSH